jgi:hypothetical protein
MGVHRAALFWFVPTVAGLSSALRVTADMDLRWPLLKPRVWVLPFLFLVILARWSQRSGRVSQLRFLVCIGRLFYTNSWGSCYN